jgi:hypothetical protein
LEDRHVRFQCPPSQKSFHADRVIGGDRHVAGQIDEPTRRGIEQWLRGHKTEEEILPEVWLRFDDDLDDSSTIKMGPRFAPPSSPHQFVCQPRIVNGYQLRIVILMESHDRKGFCCQRLTEFDLQFTFLTLN